MIICLVCESTATGTLAMVHTIAKGMLQKGHQVHLIYSVRSDTPKNIVELFDGVQMHYIPMNPKKSFNALVLLRKTIVKINPDVVHLHSSIAGFLGRISLFFDPKFKVYYSPHCISFMRKDVGIIKKRFFTFLEKISCVRRSVYIACSKSELLAIRNKLHEDAILIENGIDIDKIIDINRNQKKTESNITILNVGGLRPQKDPVLFSKLSAKLSSEKIKFVWIGDGDEDIKRQLTDSGTLVTGWLQQDQVLAYYKNADIFLSTSQWEGLPVAMIEAMASMNCVVANACDGNVDLIEDGLNGLLFDGSEKDAYDKIHKVLSDTHLRDKLASQAHYDSVNKFNKNIFLDKIEKAYELH
ncbi:group 1 glycosyl transferase [Klebsiella variicola]|uniref:Glycosyl transferase n=2 Tax=Klebsiella/Raoultella group TaxID=2890311 RepID=A0A0P0YRV6_9ENTR|nr:glycosyl transferase [Klebsiella sp. 3534/51]GKM05159.1 glycosyl transferase [Klebsiella variicola]SBI13267.1 group 1 glycosyl transferase [Klebsiella variicola]SXF49321.1 group 1 glycosyl transferase [Klebsiella variicola]